MREEACSRVSAVVLAAGLSQRMGRLKMLLPFGEKPMLARVVESLLALEEISSVMVVTGHAAQKIVPLLDAYDRVQSVHNAEYAAGGMLSSVQAGVLSLPKECKAFFLALGDQPMVQPETLRALLRTWEETSAPILLPAFSGKRGHPLLFDARCKAGILALPGEATLKTFVTAQRAQTIEISVEDAAVLADVDTPEDYQRALARWQKSARQTAA